ncbi:c-type cytochrome [Hymenobacter radiodurans]|uniref:c-type cytochrome n=1 Tax=Hymenobacter radiodurans TaxID=2496028 RepID=UPI0010591869|nr:cytochrome c [Hymenobacter radiodurans]
MRQGLLAGVIPVALALLVCTMGVLFLSAVGLLHNPANAIPTADLKATSLMALDSIEQPVAAQDSLSNSLSEADLMAFTAGQELFTNNCTQCHAINEVVVGPALKDIHERRPISWLIPWIQNSSKMVAAGDEHAVKIYKQYQKQEMPSFALTDVEIQQLVKYIEIESSKREYLGGCVFHGVEERVEQLALR